MTNHQAATLSLSPAEPVAPVDVLFEGDGYLPNQPVHFVMVEAGMGDVFWPATADANGHVSIGRRLTIPGSYEVETYQRRNGKGQLRLMALMVFTVG